MLRRIDDALSVKLAKLKGEFCISAKQSAKKNRISYSYMRTLIINGRVTGAYKLGSYWAVPGNWKFRKRVTRRQKDFEYWNDPPPILSNQDPSIHHKNKMKELKKLSDKGVGLDKLSKQFGIRKSEIWAFLRSFRKNNKEAKRDG